MRVIAIYANTEVVQRKVWLRLGITGAAAGLIIKPLLGWVCCVFSKAWVRQARTSGPH